MDWIRLSAILASLKQISDEDGPKTTLACTRCFLLAKGGHVFTVDQTD